jgi:hypothetical protein
MKPNWGLYVTLLYLSFVGMMSYLVYRCTGERVDLVTDHYYERELQYDVQYEKEKNAQALAPLVLAVHPDRQTVDIVFPDDAGDPQGTIRFYKPDRASLDFQVPVTPTNRVQTVSTRSLARGLWRVQADWSAGGVPYYQEQQLLLD